MSVYSSVRLFLERSDQTQRAAAPLDQGADRREGGSKVWRAAALPTGPHLTRGFYFPAPLKIWRGPRLGVVQEPRVRGDLAFFPLGLRPCLQRSLRAITTST